MIRGSLTPGPTVLSVLVALAVAAGTIAAYFRSSVSKVWRDTAEGWQARAALLEEQNEGLTKRVSALELEVAVLRGKTDLSAFEDRQRSRDEEMLSTFRAGNQLLVTEIAKLTSVIAGRVVKGGEL